MTFIFYAYVPQEYEVLLMNKAEIKIVNSPPTFLFITTPFTQNVWKKEAKRDHAHMVITHFQIVFFFHHNYSVHIIFAVTWKP